MFSGISQVMDKLKSIIIKNMDIVLGTIFIAIIFYHSKTIYMYCDELFNLLSLVESLSPDKCAVVVNF